jgi:hypothetical protein
MQEAYSKSSTFKTINLLHTVHEAYTLSNVTKRYDKQWCVSLQYVTQWYIKKWYILQNGTVTALYKTAHRHYGVLHNSTIQSQSTELHQPLDWLGVKPNLANPGNGQSQSTKLHQPMESLG